VRDPGSGWIQLSATEFFLLWSGAGHSSPPVALAIGHVGRTAAHRSALVEEASAELQGRDLGSVAAPARDLAGLLRSVAEARVVLDVHVHGAGDPLPAGSERPANIGAADFAAACAEGEQDGAAGFLSALRYAGVRPDEADTVCRVLTTRTGGGQLGVVAGGRRGPVTVNWVDTPDGRYALRRTGGWVTVTPVDLPRLSAMAEELL
jgi:hypothetical protein